MKKVLAILVLTSSAEHEQKANIANRTIGIILFIFMLSEQKEDRSNTPTLHVFTESL